jgi:chromosome partitioning protein
MISSKTIAFALAKGGTGKSTSSLNISAALASLGHKVVLVDNDPQGSLTIALGQEPKAIKHTLASKMQNLLDDSEGTPIQDCLIHCSTVDLLPSNQKLALVEKRLTIESKSTLFADDNALPSELVMRKALEPLRERYDYILIDCPPSAGMLTVNAMAASDSVLIPMESHFLGFEAIKQTLELIGRVKGSVNPTLQVEGILLTKFQDRTTLCRTIRDSVLEAYGENLHIFTEPIAYSIKAAEQAVIGASIFETDPRGKIAQGYMAAAREVIAHG